MFIFLSILIVIACVLLVGAVLIQKSKGGGLASDYSQGNQYLGYRKTTDFIEKATWSLAVFICVISILASFTISKPTAKSSIAPVQAETAAPFASPTNNPSAPTTAPAAPEAPAQQ